jgi:hypothetical protein
MSACLTGSMMLPVDVKVSTSAEQHDTSIVLLLSLSTLPTHMIGPVCLTTMMRSVPYKRMIY